MVQVTESAVMVANKVQYLKENRGIGMVWGIYHVISYTNKIMQLH